MINAFEQYGYNWNGIICKVSDSDSYIKLPFSDGHTRITGVDPVSPLPLGWFSLLLVLTKCLENGGECPFKIFSVLGFIELNF